MRSDRKGTDDMRFQLERLEKRRKEMMKREQRGGEKMREE